YLPALARASTGAIQRLRCARVMTDLPRGRIKQRPEDFVVDEIPAYPPTGAGEHVFVRFTKRDMTTMDAAKAIATALGCDPRATGAAGMKDKRAVATQTISLQAPTGTDSAAVASRALSLAVEGLVVHEATPHGHKIKPGHLVGNRFTITVRDVARDRIDDVVRGLERVAGDGVPNAFGKQRFGAGGDNAARALAWLLGKERGPRDRRAQRFLWSSLQSAVFNEVLDARVGDGTWTTALEGDLLKRRQSGGLFVCTTVQTDAERAARGEVSPTGPMVGARMIWPQGAPGDLERRIVAAALGDGFDLEATRRLGEGSRRALRMWVQDVRWEIVDDVPGHGAASIRVYFVLPKGGYATTVLAAVVAVDETREPNASSSQPLDDTESETISQ
ncbi:MAG: tRNA pseudouridine(13) synthase TruD, partial [Myxococcota bacterium]|nr:tRNA pseudouridine(13) synthase TruD [Myxococcota bacterium]